MIALLSAILVLVPSISTHGVPTPVPTHPPGIDITRPYVLPPNFQFAINGAVVSNVQGIDGLDQVLVQYWSGNSWRPKIKVPGKPKWVEIKLKRGMTTDNSLFEWRQKVIDGKIDEARSDCTITGYPQQGTPYQLILHRCWPSRYVGHTHLNSQGPETAGISFDSIEVQPSGGR